MTDAPSFILPHASGGGEPRICAVEGVSAATLAAMLTPPPPCSAWFPSPAFAGEDKTILFSRRARRPRFAYHHNNKALLDSPPAHKEGSGAPRGASNQCPRHTSKRHRLNVRGARKRAKKSGRARLPALHCGTRQGSYPLAQLRAALPGITGCKREDPPRRQCSEHLADRS